MDGGRKNAGLAAAAAAAIMLGWSAWRYGLFFDANAYPVELILYAAAVVWAGFSVRQGGLRASWPVLLPLGMAACYGLALLLGPVSFKGTADSMLRWTAYSAWCALLTASLGSRENRPWGEAAVQAAGVFLLAGGWLGWFGWLPFPQIVLHFDDPELSTAGYRLAGFFQYPNAYGAVLAFFLLRQWQAWAEGAKSPYMRLACLTSVFYAGALLLTESRGALAALLAGFLLALLWADNRRMRVKLTMAAVWSLLAGAAVSRGALRAVYGTGGGKEAGAWLTAAGLAAGLLAMYGLWRRLALSDRREDASVRFPYAWQTAMTAAALLAALAIFSGNGGLPADGRLSGNYGTAASRLLYYRDAWRMFCDSPWFGFGGDGWRSLFGLYQSKPYVGGEVHSGYLDILLDTGLLGFAVLAVLLGRWVFSVWKVRREALAPAAVLLIHSAVDFDWSYAWMWLLLFAWLSPFAAGEADRPPAARRRPTGGRIAAALLAAASLWGGWAAWHGWTAAREAAAADMAAEPAARAAHLRAALAANPAWERVRINLAALLPDRRERAAMLAQGLRYEPQSAPLRLRLGLAEAEEKLAAQAEADLREGLRLERFSSGNQTAAIAAMARLAETFRFDGSGDLALQADRAVVSFYENYRRLVREVEAMRHSANGKRFAMTPSAEFHAAQSYLALGRNAEAAELLRRLAAGNDPDWSEQALELLKRMDSSSP